MKNRNPHRRGLAGHSTIWMGICTITFCAFTAGQAMAQSVWSGAAGVNWNDGGNWDAIPADNGALTFGGGTPANQPSNNDFPALITGAISFTNAGPAGTAPNDVTSTFTLDGNAITLGGNITTSAVQATGAGGIDITDTIGMSVILNATRTISTTRAGGTGGNRLSHNIEISGQITESGGSWGLTKAQDANLILSNAANSFTGDLTIGGAGAVVATSLKPSGTPSSIGSGNAINFTNNNATLKFIGTDSASAATDRSINLTSTSGAGGCLDNSSASVPVTFNGAFTNIGSAAKPFTLRGTNTGENVLSSDLVNGDAGGVLSFTKSEAGTWALSGNNTFTGNVLIDNGTLRVSTIGESGSSNLGLGALVQIGNSSRSCTLDYTGTGSITGRQVKIGGFVNTTGSGSATILASATAPSTGLKFTATNFNAAEGTIPASAITRILTLGGDNPDPNEISGAITDGNASVLTTLNKSGAGLWILSGQNSHTGIANVGGGVTGSTVVSGGTLQVNQATNGLGNSTASNAINLNGGTLSLRNDGAGNNGTITYGSTSNPSGYNVQLTTNNSTIHVANLTANTGNTITLGPLTQASPTQRNLNVTGANGYSLTLPSLGLCPGNGQTTTLSPTTANLIITGNVNNPMVSWTGGATNYDTLTLSGSSTGNRILGVISDAVDASDLLGGLTRINKTGTSTWELNGNNTNDGTMTVGNGTLLINGDSSGATGNVTVNGGTLGGAGSIGGAVTVAAGGSLAPGNAGVGTLTLASDLNVTAQATGTGKLNFQLGTIAASDKITVGGTLTIGNGILGFSDFNFSTLAGLTNDTYPLITGAIGLGVDDALDAADLTGLLGAGPAQGELQLSGSDLVLVVTGAVASDPFLTWTGNNPSILFDGDENNDDVENGQAWFLGAGSPADNATGLLPKSSQTAGALVLEFDCLDATARGAGVFQVQYSTNLTAWAGTDVPGTVGTFTAGVVDFVVTDPAPAGGLLKVVATIPVTQAVAGKLFSRLRAER